MKKNILSIILTLVAITASAQIKVEVSETVELMSKQTFNEMFNETWRNGFRWTPELVNSLRYYANNRDKYKTLNDYYSEIVKCLDQYINTEATRMQNALK